MLLQAYALISTNVRLTCTNQVANGPRATVLSTQAGRSMRENIVAVFGSRLIDALQAMRVEGGGGMVIEGYVCLWGGWGVFACVCVCVGGMCVCMLRKREGDV